MQRLAPRARRWLLGRRVSSPARARPTAAARPAWLVTLVLGSTVAGGALLVAWSLAESQRRQLGLDLLPLAALVVAAELLRVQVYEANRQRIELSFSIAVIMGAVTLHPAGTPLIGLAAAATHVVMTRQRRVDKALFNLANVPLAAAAAAGVSVALGPPPGSFGLLHLVAALAAVLAYYGVNIGLISLMVSLHAGRPLLQVLREAAWFGPANVLLGLTGAFVGSVQAQLGWIGSLMFTVPLLLLRFTLTFHARMSRETIRTLERQARHDDLTGLPNRTFLRERLGEMVARSGDGEARFALLLLDLDRFKEVNDTFGHHHGDLLLEQVSVRLRSVLRGQDTVARLGGDEFAILLPAADAAGAYRVAEQIRQALVRPYVVEGYRLEVDASIGIALYPEHGRDAGTLLRRADVAMYVAKRAGSGAALYAAELDQHHPSRLALIADLRQAIEQDQLLLHFQPKVAARDGRFVGVEALVRWRHPERGFVPPDQFIPLAEQTGLIQPLSRWVVNAALRQARAWQELGLRVPVAVNLSVRNLSDLQLPDLLAELLAIHGVAADRFRVEVTESVLMSDPARALETLGRLRRLGVGIAVDDFGTGHSSLAYLAGLPIDEIKIDRSFVRDLVRNQRNEAIVRSTIALAHDLGHVVVAEGVEDQATWERLGALGCDLLQGYHISRPLPAGELVRWLDAWTGRQGLRPAA